MALISAMLKGAKTINRWCLSHLQIRISWLFASIWSLLVKWMKEEEEMEKKDDL